MNEFLTWDDLYQHISEEFPTVIDPKNLAVFSRTCRELFGRPAVTAGNGKKVLILHEKSRYLIIGLSFYFKSESDAILAKLAGG